MTLGEVQFNLTVNSHDPFWLVAVAILVAFICGGFISWFSKVGLSKLLGRTRRARAQDAASASGVTGLENWLSHSSINLSPNRQAQLLNHLRSTVLAEHEAKLDSLRVDLAELRQAIPNPPDVSAVSRFLARNPDISDFFDRQGKTVEHPSEDFKASLNALLALDGNLRALEFLGRRPTELGGETHSAALRLRKQFQTLSVGSADFGERIDWIKKSTWTHLDNFDPPAASVAIVTGAATVGGTSAKGRAMLVAVTSAIALATVLAAIGYASIELSANPSFGSTGDYVNALTKAVFSSAVLSSLGATLEARFGK